MTRTHSRQKPPEERLRLLLSILVLVIAGSTLGYWILDPRPDSHFLDALYMTFITIATVGYKEVFPLTDSGKFFTIIVIAFSATVLVYTIGTLGQLFIEGEIREILGRRKMDKRIKKLKEHFIIAGYGRVGQVVQEVFERMDTPFVVLEQSPELCALLEENCPLHIEADATNDKALIEAGIESARGLVCTIPSEADSVFLTLSARQLNPGIFIIARANSKSAEKKLIRAGADRVVQPHEIGGRSMAMASLKPTLVDILQIDTFGGELGLSLEQVEVRAGSPIAGKRLMESELRSKHNVTVLAIKDLQGKMKVNPPPDTVIGQGDVLVLVGESKILETLNLTPEE